MSYALTNYLPTARRHNRSGTPPATGPGCYGNTGALWTQQQEESPHLLIRRQNRSEEIPRPLSPNYSIVPSTTGLERTWIKPSLKTFPQFTKFLAELRIKIYKQVEFRFRSETPTIMQVSYEARKESQRLDIYPRSPNSPFPFPRIWLKPTVDIICPVRNGRTPWTETQFSIFAQIIIYMWIERLGLDNFVSPNYKSEAALDEWNNFGKFAKWMNQNLHQILLYTSLKQFNIHYQPLKLVETKNYPEQSSEVLMITSVAARRRFEELYLMMLDLEASRTDQNIIGEVYEDFAREKEKMPWVPGWLYEHGSTWVRPEPISLSAL
ncbi:56bae075-102b-4bb3-bfc1-089d8f62fbc0 [Sclerotinia trifoliorum]|uniref:56bae075-102b-4bb3-bfc1-089d8f62fbc0 n=1 Tax=Sclerotinia trifoliorum TaxID=28548 RepID=A0A8H2ZMH9_9HELO|nr:56bae075-102b-4bb3-bfc1-089d8f62fbc0 [Sclerotinia trifoliorum]